MDPCTIPELDFNATNLAEAWRKWKSAMQLYLDTLPPSVKERQKTAKMLLQIGEKGRDVYSTWKIESAELTVALLMKKFGEYCEPKKNLIIERHKFLHHDQVEGESIDSYVTTLKKLASYCEFQQLEEGLVLTKLIGGIRSDGLRRNLLKDSADLTLEKALNMCKADEMTAKHLALFDQKKQTETQQEAEVDAVSRNWSKSTSKQRLEKRNTRERDGYDGTRDQCQRAATFIVVHVARPWEKHAKNVEDRTILRRCATQVAGFKSFPTKTMTKMMLVSKSTMLDCSMHVIRTHGTHPLK